jgi:hypothetical protein
MIRRISFLILSVAILVNGVIAFNKLNFWKKSVEIFSFDSNAVFGARMGNSSEEGKGVGDRGKLNIQDGSVRQGRGKRNKNVADSLKKQLEPNESGKTDNQLFKVGVREREGRGRSEFTEGKKINLRIVLWFFAVFASFTVLVIYIDNGISLIRKRKA